MRIKLSNTKLILVAVMLGMAHSGFSQIIAEMGPPLLDKAPFKGVQLTISTDGSVITDSSTNVLRCCLINGSTNTILWLKRWGSVIFENNRNRQIYYLPAFGTPNLVQVTNQIAYLKTVELKVGESCEWIEYFSIGHPFDPAQFPKRDATNENAKAYYENLNSTLFIKENGNYRVKILKHIRTPKGAVGRIDWDLNSNDLELQVGGLK